MQTVIKTYGLTKVFGKARGIDDISLEVPEGTIYGFLGPNGAGKSTTINMLVNLTNPTKGRVEIFGKDNQKQALEIRQEIGYLSSDMSLDGHLTGWQQLEYFGAIRGGYDKKHVRELAVRLDCNLGRKIKTLSRGNRQKVGLISALMHKPKLLILDEPTSGLDPLIQAEFNKIILEHKKAGNTTFISSHVLSEIQELCDTLAFIRRGKLVAQMSMEDLLKSAPKQVRIISDDTTLQSSLKQLDGINRLTKQARGVQFSYSGRASALLKALAKHRVEDLTIENTDLEQAFMSYYEDDNGEQNA